MRIALQRQRDGSLRPQWYGHAQVDGKEKVYPLTRWRGTPPASGHASGTGDADFEQSRSAALDMLRQMVDKNRSDADRQASLEKIHAVRYNEKVEDIRLRDLADRWDRFPRKRRPSDQHRGNVHVVIGRFVAHCEEHAACARTLDAVPTQAVQGFLDAEEARGLAPKTWNATVTLLRSLYKRLAPFAPGGRLLRDMVLKEDAPQHRVPFTAEELQRVFEAAKADPLLRPLVTCAATTAMRRGDVCRLRWKDVDLEAGFVTVKTSKTGETVDVPIFPQLRPELEAAKNLVGKSPFVWPEAAQLYEKQPVLLDRRLRAIMTAAGFVDPEREKRRQAPRPPLPTKPPAVTKRLALAAVDKAKGWTDKRRETAHAVVTRYLEGESVKAVARALDLSPGTVSDHLNEIARRAGCEIVRRSPTRGAPAEIHGNAVAEADPQRPRLKRASLRGWHSFRTTWITLALANGLPMEMVRRVTGHTTVDVVLNNYFRPGREAFRAALAATMPRALVGECSEPTEPEGTPTFSEARRIVDGAKTLKEARAALRALDTAKG